MSAAEQLICVPGAELRGGVVGPSCVLFPRPSGFSWRLVRTKGGSRVDNSSRRGDGWSRRLRAQLAREWGSVKEGVRGVKENVRSWVHGRRKGGGVSFGKAEDDMVSAALAAAKEAATAASSAALSKEERIALWESVYNVVEEVADDAGEEVANGAGETAQTRVKWPEGPELEMVREFASAEGRKAAARVALQQAAERGWAESSGALGPPVLLGASMAPWALDAQDMDDISWDIASMSARRRRPSAGGSGPSGGVAVEAAEASLLADGATARVYTGLLRVFWVRVTGLPRALSSD